MQYFSKTFWEYIKMENQTIQIKILREKYLTNMINNQSLSTKKIFYVTKGQRIERLKKKLRN